jgi:hypothetical protein
MTIQLTSIEILSHDLVGACKFAIETATPHSIPANRNSGTAVSARLTALGKGLPVQSLRGTPRCRPLEQVVGCPTIVFERGFHKFHRVLRPLSDLISSFRYDARNSTVVLRHYSGNGTQDSGSRQTPMHCLLCDRSPPTLNQSPTPAVLPRAGPFTHPCVRPATVSQRRDSDSPPGLSAETPSSPSLHPYSERPTTRSPQSQP